MNRFYCSLPLFVALAVLPRTAGANPLPITALRATAETHDSDTAQEQTPPAGSTTTEVKVAVSSGPSPAPSPPVITTPEPRPPTAQERYQQKLHSQIRDDRKTGSGLLAGGLVVAGISYLITSLSGAVAIDRSRDLVDNPSTDADEGRRGERRRAYGRALLIPGIGPALAIARSDRAVRAWAAGMAGLTQALGVGLALLGTHRLLRARRLKRLSLSAAGSARQARVALQVRF
ncbi:MAG: hypothetical protein AAGF11_08925 [Myxococcota bacterium]